MTFHQPIQPILDAYGLVLQTEQTCGRLNPGYGLANGGTVTSCDGRFVLAMQGDGHLVLYQAGVGAIWWNGVFGSGHNLQMQTDGHLVVYYPHLLVLPEYQGRGVGSHIFRMLMARYAGFHQHMLVADGKAIEFYRKCGFERAGQTEPMWIYAGLDH